MSDFHKIYPEIQPLTAHELRHTRGTELRRNGADIYTIQKLMGHKDINVTANIYVHDDVETTRKAAKIV
jgi:integrase